MKRSAALMLTAAVAVGGIQLVSSTGSAGAYTPTVKPQAQTIAAGAGHTLVIEADGRVYGVGSDSMGQLGGIGVRTTLTPVPGLPKTVRAISVAAGAAFSLVLGSDGKVYGTGDNAQGQLTGTLPLRSTLTPLTGLPAGVRATSIAAGSGFSLVVGSDGRAYGTGDNSVGQIASAGSKRTSLTPLTGLPAGLKAKAVAAGTVFSLVITTGGRIFGTGINSDGQIGGTGDKVTLTEITGFPTGVTISAAAAGSRNSVLLGSDHRAYLLGSNGLGQFGNGISDTNRHPAPTMYSVSNVVAVACSFGTVTVIDSSGSVYGSGDNGSSQLSGAGATHKVATKFTFATGQPTNGKIVEISSAIATTVVRDSQGVVLGTGTNAAHQLSGGFDRADLTFFIGQRVVVYKAPTVTGTAKVGQTLTTRVGSWSVVPAKYAVQWYRNGHPIKGANRITYKLTTADRGTYLTVKVTGARTNFASGYAVSGKTHKIA